MRLILPFIPGHEGVGIIERLDTGNAHGLEVGDRVAVPWLGYACGDCGYCNSGRETLCAFQLNTGYAINGGFAEYAVGYAPRRGGPSTGLRAGRVVGVLNGRPPSATSAPTSG